MAGCRTRAWPIRGAALVLASLMVATLFVPSRMAEAAVQTLTGNYVYTWSDIGAADDGMPLFERTYNSVDDRVGVLGPGWTHNFNIKLVPVTGHPEGDRMFVGPMGRQDLYSLNPDESFTPSEFAQGKLERVKSSVPDVNDYYVLTQNDGTVYKFQLGGYPYQVIVPKQPAVLLSHNTQGHLLEVAGKRRYRFTYSEDGSRLLAISDGHTPQPRRITFEYDDLGRLTGVTNRLGYVTRYTYAGETHHLHEIIDAQGRVALAMTYDEQGRTLSQQNTRGIQEGKSSTFQYTSLPDGSSQATFVEPPSTFAPSWYTRTIDYYDPQGRIAGRRIETGPDDEPMVLKTGPGPRGIYGVQGCEGGKTPSPAAGGRRVERLTLTDRPFSMSVREGEPYSAVTFAIPQPEREPGRVVDILRQSAQERTVDRNGLLISVVIPSNLARLGGAWQIGYDDEDRIVSVTQTGATERTTTYRYDEVGNLVEIAESDGSVRQFEYDDRDSLIRFQDEWGATRHVEYDERHQVTRITAESADGQSVSTVEFAHDGAGRLRLVRDLSDPAAVVEFALQYECRTVVGIWQR